MRDKERVRETLNWYSILRNRRGWGCIPNPQSPGSVLVSMLQKRNREFCVSLVQTQHKLNWPSHKPSQGDFCMARG